MLSKHRGRCRFPHGHTRRIEFVLSSDHLDAQDMVVDFKALKLALGHYVDSFDHAMAMNSEDPMLEAMRQVHPECLIVFDRTDPTTEIIAQHLFDYVTRVLNDGFEGIDTSGITYTIPPRAITLERVRVWETPSSWAEYGI